ncbi:2'-5' RNA ligase family protein [Halorubrum sp. BV1]|uniref:2'-5' RNA ligase family protein n=1 Tax=Halorubrum sp. BV1 TaxID=1498500 RepID=UPI00067865C0|nr:2'-5' RNA ligase family protein [Halorubrum sp. BV1]
MFSLNVPIPPLIPRLATELHPKLTGFDRVRDRHTLVCKRFGVKDVRRDGETSGNLPPRTVALDRLRERLRPPLTRTSPFDVAVTGVDTFDAPAAGSGPVVYLTVESDGLVRLHRRLCAAFAPIEEIEGDDYVPHVTLARGGDPGPGVVADLVAGEFDPIRWRAHALDVWDPAAREVAATVEL